MEGGVMSADVSTATDEKSASELKEASCTRSRMVLSSSSVTVPSQR